MTLAKSLLLGSAAGLVAVTSGQAAELPTKAGGVKYMKVCNLYGAGFYYMPGTDLCLKIGGWQRGELTWGGNGNVTWGPYNANQNNRSTSNVISRTRGYITLDAREQTAYGVARAYIAVGIATSDTGLLVPSLVFSSNRAYVQWAGFTAGLLVSFYDFYNVAAAEYRGAYLPASDTGDGGWWVWGYTAQFGGGFSATLAAEQRRTTQICNASNPGAAVAGECTYTPGGFTTALSGVSANNGAYGGEQWPDIVANLRVDQAWGSAQVMGALHDVNAAYYSPTTGAATALSAGHPSDTVGFAVGAGLKVNFPMVAEGDYLQSQVNYTQGALRYLFVTPNSNWGKVDGSNETYGMLSDCVYAVGPSESFTTGCNKVGAWGFNASYEHYWTPQWHQSVYGAYDAVDYGGDGLNTANSLVCSNQGFGTFTAGAGWTAVAGCSNNWSTWGVGTRLQWDVTKSFYVGVEALYSELRGATTPTSTLPALMAFGGATGYEASSSNWAFTLRMHKDFLP